MLSGVRETHQPITIIVFSPVPHHGHSGAGVNNAGIMLRPRNVNVVVRRILKNIENEGMSVRGGFGMCRVRY
jgi:hypothetical protein